MNRLEYAIFERNNLEDSIVDAIIAWEGMFSEAFETTFKVTGSLSKFLNCSENPKEFHKKLKNLYNLRSVIVHGKDDKSAKKRLEQSEIEKTRNEVIKIALDCLYKLLNDDNLIKMTASERVNHILLFS